MECGSTTDLYPTQRRALELDQAAVRLARQRGRLDVDIGETLLVLCDGDRLLQLGYSRQVDYARERMGVSARSLALWLRLARALATRPLLKRAVVSGVVSSRKALAVVPLAVGAGERPWTTAAMNATVVELEAAARSAGVDSLGDSFQTDNLMLRMTPAQQDRLDAAIALAQETFGLGAPRWRCMEAICQEWLGAFGAWAPEVEERGAVRNDDAGPILRERPPFEPVELEEFEPIRDDSAHGLDERLQRLLRARRSFDERFGRLALRIVEGRFWSTLGYRSLEEYSRERLGMAARSLRERVWLERRMCALPALREALSSGRLTYSKALLVAKDATSEDVDARVEEASDTTWQQLDRESTAREDRRNRAAGVRRIWGPKDAARVVLDAISSALALATADGEHIETGEALARVADHFVEVWTLHRLGPRMTRNRREVLLRHGGLCAVPGCSRPAQHEHHIHLRSRGGSDETANRVAVCAAHHLHGIHRGFLTVTGRAGELLVWNLGTGAAEAPLETWITEGEDDVRRPRREEALHATG